MHGLGGNSVTWHGVGPLLAERLRARVVAPDLPGFGASHPNGARVGFALLSEVVENVIRGPAQNGGGWWLAGNSLGGLLSLRAAVTLPERVQRITLAALSLPLTWGRGARELAALGSYLPTATPWVGRRLVARYTRSTGLPGVVDDPIRFLFGDPSRLDPELRRRLLEVSRYRLGWVEEAASALERTTRGLGLALLRRDRAARWISEVRCPVQSIRGGKDPLFPRAAWQELERARPDWSHIELDDVGHVPQLEAPAAFVHHMLG